MFRLDYLSCVLTVVSTILVGRRCWEGWALAGANSVLMCIIGIRTEQLGFVPANIFCIVVSAINLRAWRKARASPDACPETNLIAISHAQAHSAMSRFSAKGH